MKHMPKRWRECAAAGLAALLLCPQVQAAAPAPSAPPPATSSSSSGSPAATATAPAPSTATPAAPLSAGAPPADVPSRSLLFTPEEMQMIQRAEHDYREAQSGTQDYLSTLENAGKDITDVLIQRRFYLAFVVYHAPDDWTIGLHDQQFTPDTAQQGDIRVLAVGKEQVTFVWQPRQFTFYFNRHRHVRHPQITIDAGAGTITFSLYANQTFSPADMRITEGWTPAGTAGGAVSPPSVLPALPSVPALPQLPGAARNAEGLPTAPLPDIPTFGPKDSASAPANNPVGNK